MTESVKIMCVSRKSIFFCITVFLLLFMIIPVSAAGGNENGFYYQVKEDGTAEITNCDLSGNITIPDTIAGYIVTSLAAKLFYGRSDVITVTIPETINYFGTDSIDNLWDYVFSYCYNLERIDVHPSNPVFTSVDGVLYTKDMKNLINYPAGRSGMVYNVPAETEMLCCTSFASAKNLVSVFLDSPETYWMTYTFYLDGGLTVYYLPGGYSETRAKMFIENGLSYETNTSYCKFRSYTQILEPDMSLPDGLQTIGDLAFSGVKASVIRVPGSVKVIGNSAFDSSVMILCPSGSNAEQYCIDHGIEYRTY